MSIKGPEVAFRPEMGKLLLSITSRKTHIIVEELYYFPQSLWYVMEDSYVFLAFMFMSASPNIQKYL